MDRQDPGAVPRRAPRVRLHEPTGTWRWTVGDRWCSMVGNYSMAGWQEFPPSCPPTLEDADPACYDAAARLAHMDVRAFTPRCCTRT